MTRPKSREEICEASDCVTQGPTLETRYATFPATISLHTIIGRRKSQEDRFCYNAKIADKLGNCGFYGVFDGTVGDFVSDTVKDIIVPYLKSTASFKELEDRDGELTQDQQMSLLRKAFKSMYSLTDQELLRRSGLVEKHYATCTSVTLLMWNDLICVGHLGDSRACLIFSTNENLEQANGTTKPAQYVVHRASSKEIEEKGGSGEGGGAKKRPDIEGGGSDNGAAELRTVSTTTPSEEENQDSSKENSSKKSRVTSKIPSEYEHLQTMKTLDGLTAVLSDTKNEGPWLDPEFVAPGAVRVDSLPVDKVETMVEGNFVTRDHKPDQAEEKSRIEMSGGSVEYLQNHQNKPFIRGGDFQQRKLLGESPMQLQYSRAFGGKDLKPFGLTAEPTINVTKRERQFLGFILASDGLWDVIAADQAARIATKAHLLGQNPAVALVNAALDTSGDNITAMCVMYDTLGGHR